MSVLSRLRGSSDLEWILKLSPLYVEADHSGKWKSGNVEYPNTSLLVTVGVQGGPVSLLWNRSHLENVMQLTKWPCSAAVLLPALDYN